MVRVPVSVMVDRNNSGIYIYYTQDYYLGNKDPKSLTGDERFPTKIETVKYSCPGSLGQFEGTDV